MTALPVAARRPGAAALGLLAALVAPLPAQAPVRRPAPAPVAGLPPVPLVRGAPRVTVLYPARGQLLDIRDSTFLFGSVGTGEARLAINGDPVRVWPNGAWLAWVPVPDDTLVRFELVAEAANGRDMLVHQVRRPARRQRPGGLWVDAASVRPRGRVVVPPEEWLPLSVRASPGAAVVLVLGDGTRVPLVPDPTPEPLPDPVRRAEGDEERLAPRPSAGDRYVGLLRGRAIAAGSARLVARRGSDSVEVPWPADLVLLDSLPRVVRFDDDTGGRGDTDSTTIGRPTPDGTYTWFFPTGTRAVLTGRRDDMVRVRLSRAAEAWVPVEDVWELPRGTPPPAATLGSLTLAPGADRLLLRLPLDQRVPFRVDERADGLAVLLYGARADADRARTGATDPWVAGLGWSQRAADEVEVVLALRRAPWGWRARWRGTDLLLEVRRPPVLEARRPLRGRRIAIDAGHPPAGATGPTGLREREANLAVARRVQALLERAGATVQMIRQDDRPLALPERTLAAERAGADLLVSIHNNALPDGVEPFGNSGTSVFHFWPSHRALAEALQAALLRRLGTADLGVARADLHMVRPSWMPSALTEGLFMMLPEHEAALRSAAGQQRYAEGVVAGIEAFLRQRAAEGAERPLSGPGPTR
ncbi:MAG: N-acetylmuramoyl-L-alanine amidase [Gemmatimonadales bacterium]|nr:N-acetylmuramoyl-L-alanine amidase [Gemmatimonadales bacterium]